MPYRILLPMTVAVSCLLFCSMVKAPQGFGPPACTCTDLGATWFTDALCQNTRCSQFNNGTGTPGVVVDNLTCSGAPYPGPCTVGGSITVYLDNCSSVACVSEFHSACGVGTCGTAGPTAITVTGTQYPPTVGACCGQGCDYWITVTWFSQLTTCPGNFIHCEWYHKFQCDNST